MRSVRETRRRTSTSRPSSTSATRKDLETLIFTIPGVIAANGLNNRSVGVCVNAAFMGGAKSILVPQFTPEIVADLVKKKGLSDVHFDAVARHLDATLRELGVAQDAIEEALANLPFLPGDALKIAAASVIALKVRDRIRL